MVSLADLEKEAGIAPSFSLADLEKEAGITPAEKQPPIKLPSINPLNPGATIEGSLKAGEELGKRLLPRGDETAYDKTMREADEVISLLAGIERAAPTSQVAALVSGKWPSEWMAGKTKGVKEKSEAAMKKHPGAAAAGYVPTSILGLGAGMKALGPLGTATASGLGRIPFASPGAQAMARTGLGQLATRLPTFAGQKLLAEGAKQRTEGKFNLKGLAGEAGKGILWATVLSPMGFIPNTVPRVFTAGVAGGTYTTIEKLISKGKLVPSDLIDIGATAAIVAGAEALGAKTTSQIRKAAINKSWGKETQLVNLMSRGMTRAEAVKQLSSIETVRVLGIRGLEKVRAENPNMTPQQKSEWTRQMMKLRSESFGQEKTAFYKRLDKALQTGKDEKIKQAVDSLITQKPVVVIKEELPAVKAAVQNLTPAPLSTPGTSLAGLESEAAGVNPDVPTNQVIDSALGQLRDAKAKFISTLDVEAPFRAVGAPETGFNIKVLVSRKAAGEEKSLKFIKGQNNFGLSEEDYQDVYLLTEMERPGEVLSPNKQAALDNSKAMFASYKDKLQEAGVLKRAFPESLINTLTDNINDLKSKQDALYLEKLDSKTKTAVNRSKRYDKAILELKKRLEKVEAAKEAEIARVESKMFAHVTPKLGVEGIKAKGEAMLGGEGIKSKAEANIRIANIYGRQIGSIERQIAKLQEAKNAILNNTTINLEKYSEYQQLQSGIDNSLDSIGVLKQIRYVPLQSRIWFESEHKFNPEGFSKSLASFRNIKGRKTVSVNALVESGAVDKSKLDIRDVGANYIRYVEGQIAEKKIVDSIIKEKLAIEGDKAPEGWREFPSRYAPGLKGYKVHPAVGDYLEEYFRSVYRPGSQIGKIMAQLKMMQFYNPVFLPMYDTVQSAMLGSLFQPGLPKHFWSAGKMIIGKNSDYWEAYENGLFSTPYTNPHEEFNLQLQSMKGQINNAKFIMDKLKTSIRHPIASLYNLSWNIAWTGDKYIRLISYNYLKDKGYSSKDAAQIAALFHGDYASVPPATRRMLNKVFFTPTFKIVMAKLYDRMVKGAIKTTMDLARGKSPDKKDALFGKGLLMVGGIVFGKDLLMTRIGFQREQFCRKYFRTEETDDGEEVEVAITFANPANLVQRYWYKFKPVFNPWETDRGGKLLQAIKSEFHPLYLIIDGYVRNQDEKFEPIVNPFDPPYIQAFDTLSYFIRRTVRISEVVLAESSVGEKKAQQAINNSKFKFFYKIVKPVTFQYVRAIEETRDARKIKLAISRYRRFLITDPPKTEGEFERRGERLNEMLEKMQEEIDAKNKSE